MRRRSSGQLEAKARFRSALSKSLLSVIRAVVYCPKAYVPLQDGTVGISPEVQDSLHSSRSAGRW